MMKIFSFIVFALAVLFIFAGAFFLIYGREKTWALVFGNADLGAVDMATIERSLTDNDALICSPSLCSPDIKIDVQLDEYEMSPEALISQIDAALMTLQQPLTRVDDGADPAYIRYVSYSPTLRFPDTMQFKAVALENGKTGLFAYARAQIGKLDMGANLARLQKIINAADL